MAYESWDVRFQCVSFRDNLKLEEVFVAAVLQWCNMTKWWSWHGLFAETRSHCSACSAAYWGGGQLQRRGAAPVVTRLRLLEDKWFNSVIETKKPKSHFMFSAMTGLFKYLQYPNHNLLFARCLQACCALLTPPSSIVHKFRGQPLRRYLRFSVPTSCRLRGCKWIGGLVHNGQTLARELIKN